MIGQSETDGRLLEPCIGRESGVLTYVANPRISLAARYAYQTSTFANRHIALPGTHLDVNPDHVVAFCLEEADRHRPPMVQISPSRLGLLRGCLTRICLIADRDTLSCTMCSQQALHVGITTSVADYHLGLTRSVLVQLDEVSLS